MRPSVYLFFISLAIYLTGVYQFDVVYSPNINKIIYNISPKHKHQTTPPCHIL